MHLKDRRLWDRNVSALVSVLIHASIFLAAYRPEISSHYGSETGRGMHVVEIVDLYPSDESWTTTQAEPVEDSIAELVSAAEAPSADPQPLLSEDEAVLSSTNTPPSVNAKEDSLRPLGNSGSHPEAADDDLFEQYRRALRQRILAAWKSTDPSTLPSGCTLYLQLEVGGGLALVNASDCQTDEETRLRLEAVTMMAQPMPFEGYEPVFSSVMELSLSER